MALNSHAPENTRRQEGCLFITSRTRPFTSSLHPFPHKASFSRSHVRPCLNPYLSICALTPFRSDIKNATKASTTTFLTALVFNGAVFAAEIAIFTLIRPYFKSIYEPRTYVPPEEYVPSGVDLTLLTSWKETGGALDATYVFVAVGCIPGGLPGHHQNERSGRLLLRSIFASHGHYPAANLVFVMGYLDSSQHCQNAYRAPPGRPRPIHLWKHCSGQANPICWTSHPGLCFHL